MNLSKSINLAVAFALAVAFSSCKTTQDAGSITKDAVDAASLPQSIHDKSLPLGSQVGVVMSVTTSGLGGYDTDAVNAMTDALKSRNSALKAANKKLLFVAPAINAHAVFFSSVAANKIAAQDADSVNQAKADLGLDEDTVRSQVVLFFNDSSSRKMKAVFGNDADVAVSVINAAGEIAGKFTLPAEQDAALAALDAALAAQAQ